MKSSAKHPLLPFGLIVIGLAICGFGIYIGETDDAPGAALAGVLLMIVMVFLGARMAWRRFRSRPSNGSTRHG
jgi:hypothetical protein